MSRGDRATVTGIISTSMRDNYGEYGVAEYYKKVGSTYRNPHYPGVRLCIFAWLHQWWSNESSTITSQGPSDVLLFDMACVPLFRFRYHKQPGDIVTDTISGSGEVTLAFSEWLTSCKNRSSTSSRQPSQGNSSTNVRDARTTSSNSSTAAATSLSRKLQMYCTGSLGPNFPTPLVVAADPFTSVAYKDRTSLPCANLSFNDIAEGDLPPLTSDISKMQIQARSQPQGYHDNSHSQKQVEIKEPIPSNDETIVVAANSDEEGLASLTSSARQEPYSTIEMVVCSFALHLIETPSELFALLCALSYKARWLVVLAPHKKPEIKDGWGWQKWNIEEWRNASASGHEGEILFDRVHCRIYRSVNF